MHQTDPPPLIRDLSREAIDRILRRNVVGRLAFAREQRVEIQPVHYVYSDDWIYGRMEARGTKFEAVDETAYLWRPVAFEVDEVDGLYHWRSVVVRGGLYLLPEDGAPPAVEARRLAREAMKRAFPAAFTDEDPGAFRTELFRIAVQEVTGRAAGPDGV